jgi:hypothetical protein
MKFSVTHRVEENVEPTNGVSIDVLYFTVKFDNGNTLDFEYEFLPRDVDYIFGNYLTRKFSSYSQTRKKKLSLASNIWQMGWYLPTSNPKFGYSPRYHDITKHILDNKHPVEDYIPHLLALSMYIKAEREGFGIFDASVIVPVPNFCLDDNSGAVSISNELAKIMTKNGARIEFKENLLKKTEDKEAKRMSPHEKEEFYSKNKLYEFREDFAGTGYLRGKKVILVDDVITHGYAAEQCLKELSNQGAEDLCFYSVATTKG